MKINENVNMTNDSRNADIIYNYENALKYIESKTQPTNGYCRLVTNAAKDDKLYNSFYCCISLGYEISFNMNIFHDNTGTIDILDDDFCQPYDFQYMISNNKNPNKVALEIQEKVYEIMENLKALGIINNWNKGDYI